MEPHNKQLIPALIKAQAAIGSSVKKDASNPHFRSQYATLDAVLRQIHKPLTDNGLGLVQEVKQVETGIEVLTTLLHESGESMQFAPTYMPVDKTNAQGFGSAQTYGRRYSLMALFGLAPADDDGNDASKNPPPKPSKDESTIADHFAAIEAAADLDSLHAAYEFAVAYSRKVKDRILYQAFVEAKDKRKESLS